MGKSKFLSVTFTIFLLLVFFAYPLAAESRNTFTQKLEWIADDDAFEYKVEILPVGSSALEEGFSSENSSTESTARHSQSFETEDNFIEVSLPAGNYKYRVYAYDFLGKEASVSDWQNFSVIRAKMPVVEELPQNVVVSDSENTTFEIPLDVSSITEDTVVELINEKTKQTVQGHLEITEEKGQIVASSAVFPEVSEGNWHARITNPSGLFSETEKIVVAKSVEQAHELADNSAELTYVESKADRLAREKQEAEEAARLAETERIRQEEEAARIAEEQRLRDEEAKRIAQEQRRQEEEAARLAEEQRKRDEEAARLAEEQRLRDEEAKRIAEEQRLRDQEAERLAQEQKLLEEEQKQHEADLAAERQRLAQLAVSQQKILDQREEEIENLNKELDSLTEQAQQAQKTADNADANSDKAAYLQELADLMEQRRALAENSARLSEISKAYAEESLRLTNHLNEIENPEALFSAVDRFNEQIDIADEASSLAQQTYEEAEKERVIQEKKITQKENQIEKKLKKIAAAEKTAKDVNILLGINGMYSPYDKQLFSYVNDKFYGFYPDAELQLSWLPLKAGKNKIGFNLSLQGTDIYTQSDFLVMQLPVVIAQFGPEYNLKLIENHLYADFKVSGGLTGVGDYFNYENDSLRENTNLHFYLYPCAGASAGLYILPSKHFAIKTGVSFNHLFITGMPTGIAEAYVMMGLRF